MTPVLSVDTHDDLSVPHEAVDPVNHALVDSHGPHLPKHAAPCHAGEGSSGVHQEGPSDASATPGLLGLCVGDPDRLHGRSSRAAPILSRMEASSGLAVCTHHRSGGLPDHLSQAVEQGDDPVRLCLAVVLLAGLWDCHSPNSLPLSGVDPESDVGPNERRDPVWLPVFA